MRRRNRDELGWTSRLTEMPSGDCKVQKLVAYVMYSLLGHHHFTDEFITCIISLIPHDRLLLLLQDVAKFATCAFEKDDDLVSELEETVLRTVAPYLPTENAIEVLFWTVSESSFRGELVKRLKEELSELWDTGDTAGKRIPESLMPILYTESVTRLADLFSLSEMDVCLASFFFARKTYDPLDNMVDEWTHNELLNALSIVFHAQHHLVVERLLSNQPLMKHGLIVEDSRRQGYTVTCSDSLLTYLSFPGRRSMHEGESSLDEHPAYPLESFHVQRAKESTILDLLRAPRPANILLYGKEGTGKTEYARALAHTVGKRLYVFNQEGCLDNTRGRNDLFMLSLVTSSSAAEDMILLVDEADMILSTYPGGFFSLFGSSGAQSTKSLVNGILDNAQCPIIWITNRIQQIDASTKRRFTFSLEFTALPPRAIKEQTLAKLSTLTLPSGMDEEIASLAARSGLNAASVSFLVESITAIPQDRVNDSPEYRAMLRERVTSTLAANSRLITGTVPFRSSPRQEYSLAALNTSVDAHSIVTAIDRYYQAEDSGLGTDSGLRILLYGESGTGKTEFARHVADTLSRPLLIKRASDVLSPWVGISEQQVAELFREAEETRSILLLDEADSFFNSRDNAARVWERTLVNEFLTRMEEYTGVLICSTNAQATLDRAVMRRFHEAVEFYTLSAEGITELLERYFPSVSFSDTQVLDLFVSGGLTPGDFAALRGRLNFYEGDATADYIGSSLTGLAKARRGE